MFQRTAVSVTPRQNRPTDPDWWQEMTRDGGKQWQRTRMENFNAFISAEQSPPLVNMVADGWTKMPSFSVIVGSKQSREPDYMNWVNEADLSLSLKYRTCQENCPRTNSGGRRFADAAVFGLVKVTLLPQWVSTGIQLAKCPVNWHSPTRNKPYYPQQNRNQWSRALSGLYYPLHGLYYDMGEPRRKG